MQTACYILTLIALLGAFDIAYFHWFTCRLGQRPESRTEVWIHIARGFIYTAQFALVPNIRFQGAWFWLFAALFVADVLIAWTDVWMEPESRRSQGGLPRGEYFMHIVLSVLVGVYLHALIQEAWNWRALPTGIVFAPVQIPEVLRYSMLMMSAGSLMVALFEAASLLISNARPKPLHVRVRLQTSLEQLWSITQDHRLHPSWDHRFSRIEMLDKDIREGTQMIYERSLWGFVIRGFGAYKHHRLHKQSTFEFWSDDACSLIRRGVGVWLYKPLADGWVEFSTSYTYEVRWGMWGRIIDRLLFRPFFQHETERSFQRLAAMYFPGGASRVLGACGFKPASFEAKSYSVTGG